MIAVNIRALTDLSLRFADELIRNRGGILNVGSIAGFLPGPGMAVYYASKAYVLSFTEALRGGARAARRTRDRAVPRPGAVGISGSGRASCPGLIPRSSMSRQRMSPRHGYRGLMANKRAVLPGLGIKIVPLLLRLFPRGFILGGGRPVSTAQALTGRVLARSWASLRPGTCLSLAVWPVLCFPIPQVCPNSHEINGHLGKI